MIHSFHFHQLPRDRRTDGLSNFALFLVPAKILFSLLLWFFSLVGSNHYFVLSGLATSKTDDLVPSFTFGSFFCCCWWGWWGWWRWRWWRQYWWWGLFKRPLILFQVKGRIHGSRKVDKFWYFKSTSEIFAWNIELITNLLLIYRWYLRSINENIVGLQMGAVPGLDGGSVDKCRHQRIKSRKGNKGHHGVSTFFCLHNNINNFSASAMVHCCKNEYAKLSRETFLQHGFTTES